jgi:hypothetical protein
MVSGVEESAVGWVVRLVVGAALEATDGKSSGVEENGVGWAVR